MPRDTRSENQEAENDLEDNLACASALCRALVKILRSPPLDSEDMAAALRVAELAESHARTARDDWQLMRESPLPAGNQRQDR